MCVYRDFAWPTNFHFNFEEVRAKMVPILYDTGLAQLVRSLTANQKISGSIPGLVEG